YYSDVKTLVDGGKHLGKDNFFPSFALSKDEQAAANMARLSVEYTEKALCSANDILKSDILQAMMKDYNQSNVDLFLAS
ncbi:peptide-binding protein, partial [Campylobacter jejuni]|nr:peptide-binding protein [Campylobacter jejuni]